MRDQFAGIVDCTLGNAFTCLVQHRIADEAVLATSSTVHYVFMAEIPASDRSYMIPATESATDGITTADSQPC